MSTGAATKPVKRRMSAPARRERILQAALDSFGEAGYGPTSMGDIAARAGITRAVLYDHFVSKKALFLAVLEEQNAIFLGHVGASITGSGSAADRMRETMAAVFNFAERHPHAWALLFGNSAHGDAEIDATANHVQRRRATTVGMLLANDFEAAGIDPASDRAAIIVEMLISALRGAVEWRRERPEAGVEPLIEAGTDLLWNGLDHLGARA
jgi:AcrR family transcriptional regulator